MARNAEKAQAMLNRWWSMKRKLRVEDTKDMERPKFAQEINSLQSCEKWRKQLLVDISRKITEVQNAGLGEFKIRQTNDEINKLIRCKAHWEARILELGGADYRLQNLKVYDSQGLEIKGNGGYKYFGAARDLPGVRELFQKEQPLPPKKTQAELYREITYEYYGNENDIEKKEKLFENAIKQREINNWKLKNQILIDRYLDQNPKNQINDETILYLIDQDFEQIEEIVNNEHLYKNFDLNQHLPQKLSDQEYLLQKKQKLLQEYFGVEIPIEEFNEQYLNQYVDTTEIKQKIQQDY